MEPSTDNLPGVARPDFGGGVIWNRIPFETQVIPAKAGIQLVVGAFPMAWGVDSRFRGNDCTWEPPCLANDTTTPILSRLYLLGISAARESSWSK
jgi:hypothetical protein